jgi:hypothetical protein
MLHLTGFEPLFVRHDPVANHIWVISGDRVVILDRTRSVVTTHYLYYDFNSANGSAEIQVSASEKNITSHA